MSLKTEIKDRLKTYMREKKTTELTVVRQIKTEIMKHETSGSNQEASDADVIKILNSLAKQHQESIDIYRQNGREEMLEQEELELEVIRSFLPEEMSDADLAQLVDAAITETGASSKKDMGAVMKAVKAAIDDSGKSADGRKVSDLVKSKLG
jgi:uncharacterized protein YqeY